MNFRSKTAFTLAEVLITLGIIGIVAALTMPMLIQNYNKKITEVRLKKFYSVMNQTIDRLKVDYGDTENWDYTVDNIFEDGSSDVDKLVDQGDAINANFNKYFGKYIQFADKKQVNVEGKNRTLYYFKDGSAIMPQWYNSYDYEFFPKNPDKCLKSSHENRYGVCSFVFQFYTDPIYVKQNLLKGFFPYSNAFTIKQPFDKEKMYNDTSKGCTAGTHMSGNYCGLIIMLNNWTVPKDYPRKLAY